VPAVLTALAGTRKPDPEAPRCGRLSVIPVSPCLRVLATLFQGFCADTFRFLAELEHHNSREWMSHQRDRYRFSVREPLVELCQALVDRYIEPVLRQQRGWDLETVPRSGWALTSICKNDYGRSVPYQTVLWVTFYRRDQGGKRDDVQFFVRLDRNGLGYGLRL